MTDDQVGRTISNRASATGPHGDLFPLLQSIKDAAREVLAGFPDVTLDQVTRAALQAYDELVVPIDLPGPDLVWDYAAKTLLVIGVRKSWELLQLES